MSEYKLDHTFEEFVAQYERTIVINDEGDVSVQLQVKNFKGASH